MPKKPTIGLGPDYEIEDIQGINPVVIHARYTKKACCPHCGGERLWIKHRFRRWVRHESYGTRRSWLALRARKFWCRECDRYFNERFPGVGKWMRSTEGFRKEVFQKHLDGICQTTLAGRSKISPATVERWYQDHLKLRVAQFQNDWCPKELGIDEQFFSRRHGYATTLCNLKTHRVFDVTLGRSERSLERYLQGLKGRHNVQVVCMDLSSTYRSIARKYFPNARIVADRFHVIRLVNQQFLAVWKKLDEPRSRNRGLLSLMRRHESKLTEEQKQRLEAYFDEVPGLRHIYQFWRRLWKLLSLKQCRARKCRRLSRGLLYYIQELKYSPFEELQTLGKTIESWKEEIARMWRYTKNNGITEGFHNKMEMIKRRSYGFKNFENYRLRVRALCT